MTNSLIADGVELDTMAQWVGVDSNRWSVPGVKGENVLVPARHGSLWVADKTFSQGEFTLSLHVHGARDDGSVPVDQLTQTRQNIDRLLRIFTKRKKLIHFQTTMDDGTVIECYAECIGAFDVTRSSAALPYAKMNVGFTIPGAFWRDQLLSEWTSQTGLVTSQSFRMPPFEGGTAPMDDLQYLIHGPITSPELKVVESGAFTRLNLTVPSGSKWRINSADWSSVMGPNVTFDSENDPSVIGKTVHGGSATLMDLPPLPEFGLGIEIAGSNIGPACKIQVRGRRKHLTS